MVYKTNQISVYISEEIRTAKQKLGIDWRGLIIRGIKSATRNTAETERETAEKITRMATKIQDQATKIFNLEQKVNK